MVTNKIVEWVGVVTLFLFGIAMIIQGHFIVHGKHGYRHFEREREKIKSTRKQVEDLFREK
jgi:hypothetical protein